MTSNGQPDQSRSSRYVLKDYVNGKLLYCVAPPNVEQSIYHQFPERTRKIIEEKALPDQQQRAMRVSTQFKKKKKSSLRNSRLFFPFYRSTKILRPRIWTVNFLSNKLVLLTSKDVQISLIYVYRPMVR